MISFCRPRTESPANRHIRFYVEWLGRHLYSAGPKAANDLSFHTAKFDTVGANSALYRAPALTSV